MEWRVFMQISICTCIVLFVSPSYGQTLANDCAKDDASCEKHSSLMDAKIYMIKMVDVIDDRMNEKLRRYEDKITSLSQELQIMKENKAQKETSGKKFVLTFPSLFFELGTVYVKLYITTSYANVSCNVTVPNLGQTHSFDIVDGFKEVTMDKSLMAKENVKGNSGVLVESSEPVSVYAMKTDYFTRTAFLVLPYRSLSTQYLLTSVKPMPYNNSLKIYNSTISIVSANDNNYINIKLNINGTMVLRGQSYSEGDFVRISLNSYEHFVLSTDMHDLTGTIVTSSEPVAVSVGNNCGRLYNDFACSGMQIMIPPISSLGQTFIIPKMQNQIHGFRTRIVASRHSTKLTIKSGTSQSQISLEKQEWHDIVQKQNEPLYLESSEGILVTQITPGKSNKDGKGAAFMTYIPSISQYKSEYHFAVPDEELTSYASIVTRDVSNIRLDNATIPIQPDRVTTVEANEGVFQIIEIPLTSGYHVILDIVQCTFSVFVHGKRVPSLGYGYNVGYLLNDRNS